MEMMLLRGVRKVSVCVGGGGGGRGVVALFQYGV